MSILLPGVPAPEFDLPSTTGERVKLSDLRGAPVILAFYPADFSPVCGDQLALYNQLIGQLLEHGGQLLGVSVDGVWCHAAFAKERKLRFPLLSDFEPKGAVAKTYGAYRDGEGMCERALFVINGAGAIHWSYRSPIGVSPGADGIFAALDELTSGGA